MLDGILESMDMSLRKLLRYFALPILFQYKSPILWPPDVKNWLIGKHPDAGKDWKQEEKGMTEDEMVGWHHQLDGYEFEQAPGVRVGQGSLVCCSPWVTKSQTWLSDWTELNWTANNGFPGGSAVKNPSDNERDMFDPCVGKIPWSRKWLPTPVLLPGKSHGQRSLPGYSLWVAEELDVT